MIKKESLDKVIDYIKKEMFTPKQTEFLEVFLANNWSTVKSCENLKMQRKIGYDIQRTSQMQAVLMLMKIQMEEDVTNDAPSLEWTIGQYKEMYDIIKERLSETRERAKKEKDSDMLAVLNKQINEDEEGMRKLLKLITDFQNKFQDMINQELVNVNQYSMDALIKKAIDVAKELGKNATKVKWFETEGKGSKYLEGEVEDGKVQRIREREEEVKSRVLMGAEDAV